jgi:agmatinase
MQEPNSQRLDKAYTGIASFLRSRISTNLDRLDAAIAVMGIPFDEGSPFLPGTRMGPRAIREHSLRFTSGSSGIYDPERKRTYLEHEIVNGLIADVGDADIWPTDVSTTFDNITKMVRAIRSKKALAVVLGGDHSISYPVVRGFDEDIFVVQFDAHTDFVPFNGNLRFTNGHAFRHITALENVQRVHQVGVRSIRHSPAEILDSIDAGNRVMNMAEFRAAGPSGIAAEIPAGASVYVSIDIDALDISLIPGCVSGEPNGMSYQELRDSLAALAERCVIVGFDLVEVNPPLDAGTGATAYLGAHTVIEFLARICEQKWWMEACRGRSSRTSGQISSASAGV